MLRPSGRRPGRQDRSDARVLDREDRGRSRRPGRRAVRYRSRAFDYPERICVVLDELVRNARGQTGNNRKCQEGKTSFFLLMCSQFWVAVIRWLLINPRRGFTRDNRCIWLGWFLTIPRLDLKGVPEGRARAPDRWAQQARGGVLYGRRSQQKCSQETEGTPSCPGEARKQEQLVLPFSWTGWALFLGLSLEGIHCLIVFR